MCIVSRSLRSTWLEHFASIEPLIGISGSTSYRWWVLKWLPTGLSASLLLTARLWSKNRSRTGRMHSPMYVAPHKVQRTSYTTLFVAHLPSSPEAQGTHLPLLMGHLAPRKSLRTSCFFKLRLFVQEILHGTPLFLTAASTLRQVSSSVNGRVRYTGLSSFWVKDGRGCWACARTCLSTLSMSFWG